MSDKAQMAELDKQVGRHIVILRTAYRRVSTMRAGNTKNVQYLTNDLFARTVLPPNWTAIEASKEKLRTYFVALVSIVCYSSLCSHLNKYLNYV